jgi:hypothetical protein
MMGPEPGSGSGETIPQGMGLARINLDGGGARTVVPSTGASYFTLEFTAEGKAGVNRELNGGTTITVALEPGVWNLEIKGYADSSKSVLKARGLTTVSITAGTSSSFDVYLTPDFSSGGKGNLSYSIGLPSTVSRGFLCLYSIDAPETSLEIDISGGAGVSAANTLGDLPEGSYMALIDLYDGANNKAAAWTRAVHIANGSITSLAHTVSASEFFNCPEVVSGGTRAA